MPAKSRPSRRRRSIKARAMVVGLLGRKVGMTQIFDPTGQVIPVTVIQAGPCHVLQVRTQQKDGYEAVQLGYLNKPRRLASRAARGHVAKLDSKRQSRRAAAGVEALAKADCEPKRFVREFRGVGRRPSGRPGIEGRRLLANRRRRRRRHQQRPWHGRRDEAARLPRAAGHRTASRKCIATQALSVATPIRTTSSRAGEWPVITGRSRRQPAISRSCKSTWRTTCCWCAAPCRDPTAVTW